MGTKPVEMKPAMQREMNQVTSQSSRSCIRWKQYVWAATLLLIFAMPAATFAHGGGVPVAEWNGRGFHMVIEVNQDAASSSLGGVIHTTLIPTAPGGDATMRLRNLNISVTGQGPTGETAGPIRAVQILNGAYEADLQVKEPGEWDVTVVVGEGADEQSFTFTVDVQSRAWWSDLGVVGGLMIIPVLALYGMVRMAKRRQEEQGV